MTAALAALAALGAVAVVAHLIAAYALASAMTRPPRQRVAGSPSDLDLDHEDVTFASADGTVLRGWRVAARGARASVVLVHDGDVTRADPAAGLLELQRDYAREGFDVLSFDLRGRGESGGGRDSLGAGELADVLAAVRRARRLSGAPVVLHGFGTGASLALAAAARLGDAAAVIADSPAASMRAHVRRRFRRAPAHLFALAALIARWRFSADLDAVTPTRDMARLDRHGVPVLLVHCEDDRDIPVEHTLNLAAASLGGERVWTLPEGGHRGAYRADPAGYMAGCLRFIDAALPAPVRVARAV